MSGLGMRVLVGVVAAGALAKLPLPHATTVITGVVHANGSASPLAGATVMIVGGTDSTITDANGRYTLRGVPRGSVSVTTRHPGYSAFTLREFTIDSDTLRYSTDLHTNPVTRWRKLNPTLPQPIMVVRYGVDSVTVVVDPDSTYLGPVVSMIESVDVIKWPIAGRWYGPSGEGGVVRVLMKGAKGYPYYEIPR